MNALQFQKKLLSMQENMMNFALMLTANRDDAQDLMQDTTMGHRTKRILRIERKEYQTY